MDGEPGDFGGRKVDHQRDRRVVGLLGSIEQMAGDSPFGERPIDRRLDEVRMLGGSFGHLHELSDRGRTVHINSATHAHRRWGFRPSPVGDPTLSCPRIAYERVDTYR
jgi:hypothetical protein